MTRLTKDIRSAIAKAAVAHAFDQKAEELKVRADALGREAYEFLFPKSERDAVAKVPSNWFRQDSCLRLNAGGYTVRLQLLGEGLPVPYRPKGDGGGGYHCNILGAIPAGDLADRIQALSHDAEALKGERHAATRGVLGVVESVSTIKRLREVWPEGEAFFAPYEERSASLPAVRVDEINEMLGLSK